MGDARQYLRPDVLAKIARLELRARLVVEGFISGVQESPYHGFSVEFATHREYVPGDDLRHIDWRVYGRSDRFYIKQYEEETNLRVYLLLDASGSMAYPEPNARSPSARSPETLSKWDYAATLACSLAHLVVHQQDAIGLLLFDSEVRQHLPVGASRGQLDALVDMLNAARPERKTEMKMLFENLAREVRQRSLVVVISDLLTDAQDVITGLQRLRHSNHDVIVLHLLDHDEIEFPFQENVLFEGMEELEVELLTDPQSLRAAYRRAVRNFIRQVRAACLNHRIDYRLISTREPLDAALSNYLATRMHARK